jgi:hypothetical protein
VLRAAAVGAAALLWIAAARADFGEDEKKFQNDAYPLEFRQRVNASIDRGAHWLLRQQRADGSWAGYENQYPMGVTALSTLALLKAGLPADHPRVDLAFACLRSKPMSKVYDVGLLLMALDAKYSTIHDAFEEEDVDRYGFRKAKDPCAQKMSDADRDWMKEGVKFLKEAQNAQGAWRYPDGGTDLSNTQYALLGLKAASRCDVKIPVQVWSDALEFLLAFQDKEGAEVPYRANEVRGDYRIEWTEKAKARGFRYVAEERSRATGSMTTAGLAGLMICQSELWGSRKFDGALRQRTRDAIRDGLAWMQKNFSVDGNPGAGADWTHFYYLYGLERAGILGRLRFIGPHDWYREGAEHLLKAQEPHGSWWGSNPVHSSFAILFLKRATFRMDNPAITPSEPAPPPAEKPATPGK